MRPATSDNHIGDISWDHREGGRILLPLACYAPNGPNGPNGGNPCLHGSIGVAGPGSLQWRYDVKLDPAEIPKAMWNGTVTHRSAHVRLR